MAVVTTATLNAAKAAVSINVAGLTILGGAPSLVFNDATLTAAISAAVDAGVASQAAIDATAQGVALSAAVGPNQASGIIAAIAAIQSFGPSKVMDSRRDFMQSVNITELVTVLTALAQQKQSGG